MARGEESVEADFEFIWFSEKDEWPRAEKESLKQSKLVQRTVVGENAGIRV